jgi:hypothetical protein
MYIEKLASTKFQKDESIILTTNSCSIAAGKVVPVTDIISTRIRHFGFPSACNKSFENYRLKIYLHNREPIKGSEICSLTCLLSARAVTEFFIPLYFIIYRQNTKVQTPFVL